jgi:hypothetical protein
LSGSTHMLHPLRVFWGPTMATHFHLETSTTSELGTRKSVRCVKHGRARSDTSMRNANKRSQSFVCRTMIIRLVIMNTITSAGIATNTLVAALNDSATISDGLTGRHVIADSAPGTYNVTMDGTSIYSGLILSSDGSLSFPTMGGTNYATTQTSVSPAAKPLQPPTGLGGTAR